MVSSGGLFENFFHDEYIKGTPFNQHLPFLCQMALLAFDFCGGFTFDIDKLIKYMRYFETHQYDERSGLFFWRDDIIPPKEKPRTFIILMRFKIAHIFDKFIDIKGKTAAKIKRQQSHLTKKRQMLIERRSFYIFVMKKIFKKPAARYHDRNKACLLYTSAHSSYSI